jgi:ADP-heptose:LPS heptosyltransferase
MKNTTFIISGGAGRVVTAIPALEKYHRLNPHDEFKVLVHGWVDLFWSHPLLQQRSFEANQKGTFDLHIKDYNAVVPEPYYLPSFYNQETNLIEAFDEIINNTKDHSDLARPSLYISDFEQRQTKEIINQIRAENPSKKVVVFQPYGSSVKFMNGEPYDSTGRSLSHNHYMEISKSLQDIAVIIYASPKELMSSDDTNIPVNNWNPYFRVLPSFIEQCDYFIGADSCGQHIAYAMNKPGTVIMGGTVDKNYTYPDHFKIVRKVDRQPVYNPIRVSAGDGEYIDRLNQGIMDFDKYEVEQIISHLRTEIINR